MAKTKYHISWAYIVHFHKVTKSKSNVILPTHRSWPPAGEYKISTRKTWFEFCMEKSWHVPLLVFQGNLKFTFFWGSLICMYALHELGMSCCYLCCFLLKLALECFVWVMMFKLCSYSAASLTVEQPPFSYYFLVLAAFGGKEGGEGGGLNLLRS